MNRFALEMHIDRASIDIEWPGHWIARIDFPAEDGLQVYEAFAARTEVTLIFGKMYKGRARLISARTYCSRGFYRSCETVWHGVGPFVAV